MGETLLHDDIYLLPDTLVVALQPDRRVASTSVLNGGCREGMRYLYNHSYSRSPLVQHKINTKMAAPNLFQHYKELTRQLQLPVEQTVAMGTAAKLEHRAQVQCDQQNLGVQAIVTAGIDYNGGRAGDPPSYDERTGENLMPAPGTINTMLFIDAALSPGVLVQALMTATEAKAAALQELQAGSHYSNGIATGSGTDTIMVVSNTASDCSLYDAGQHSLLGSKIGQIIIAATKQALAYGGEGMTPERQGTLLWQGYRYGITPETLTQIYCQQNQTPLPTAQVTQLMNDREVMAYIAPLLHLMDQRTWGLLPAHAFQDRFDTYLNHLRHLPYPPDLIQALTILLKGVADTATHSHYSIRGSLPPLGQTLNDW